MKVNFSKNQNFLLTIACAILPIEQLEIDRYEIVTFEKKFVILQTIIFNLVKAVAGESKCK